MMFSFERIKILQIFHFPTPQDELSYKTSTMFSSGTEVVLLEMWQTRKRGLCTWYALVKEDVHRMRWITLEISPRPFLHETWSRFLTTMEKTPAVNTHATEKSDSCRLSLDAFIRSMCIAMVSVLEKDQLGESIWVIQLRHYRRSMARFGWKWIRYGVERRICRRIRDCFREEHDKKIISRYVL